MPSEVVGRAWERMCAALSISCIAAVRRIPRTFSAASTMPIDAAIQGPPLWVTMSRIAWATAARVRQTTDSIQTDSIACPGLSRLRAIPGNVFRSQKESETIIWTHSNFPIDNPVFSSPTERVPWSDGPHIFLARYRVTGSSCVIRVGAAARSAASIQDSRQRT